MIVLLVPKLCAGLDKARRECLAGARDRRDMRCPEMAGKKQRVAIGALLQQAPARAARLIRKLAETRVQLWLIDLQRMMDGVAAEQRALPLVLEVENNMAGGVSGGRLDHDRVLDGVAAVEQKCLAGFDHREHAVAIGAAALRVAIRRRIAPRIPVLVLDPRKQVAGVWNVGTQRPSRSSVFQPT